MMEYHLNIDVVPGSWRINNYHLTEEDALALSAVPPYLSSQEPCSHIRAILDNPHVAIHGLGWEAGVEFVCHTCDLIYEGD